MTASDGKFVFERVPFGSYVLMAQAAAFTMTQQHRSGVQLTVAPGQDSEDLVLKLARKGVVTGSVLNEDGAPEVGAQVFAVKAQYESGKKRLTPCPSGATARTDDKGGYRIFGLEPGKYYVYVTSRNCEWISEYYPGVADIAQAVEVPVSGGLESRIDFRLGKKRAGYSAKFKVVKPAYYVPDGWGFIEPALTVFSASNGIEILRWPARGGQNYQKVGDDEYIISGLVPGRYDVYFGSGPTFRQIARFQLQITDRDIDAGVGAFAPVVEMSGRVHFDSQPIGTERSELTNVRLSLRGVDGPAGLIQVGDRTPRVTVARNGTFSIKNVPARTYHPQLAGLPTNCYMASVRFGGREVIYDGIVVDSISPPPLDVTVSCSAARVEGTIHDARDRTVANARVVLIPPASQRAKFDSFFSTTSDQNGQFSITGIRPGSYSLIGWEDVEDGTWTDPAFLAEVEDKAVRISVAQSAIRFQKLRALPSDF